MAKSIKARKKGHPKFNVPNAGAKSRSRVKPRWRTQRGIDNKKRIKKKFMGAVPGIGYRNPEQLRHVRADGTIAKLVHNTSELLELLENPEDSNISVTIAGAVGKRKRAAIAELAKKNGIKVTNGGTS
jgi:large subunit ribosomal protein L32e